MRNRVHRICRQAHLARYSRYGRPVPGWHGSMLSGGKGGCLVWPVLLVLGATPVEWIGCIACLGTCHRAGAYTATVPGCVGYHDHCIHILPGWPELAWACERTILDATTTAAGTRPSLGVPSTGGRNK